MMFHRPEAQPEPATIFNAVSQAATDVFAGVTLPRVNSEGGAQSSRSSCHSAKEVIPTTHERLLWALARVSGFARLLGHCRPAVIESFAQSSLDCAPSWCARNLHLFERAGNQLIERIALRLCELGHSGAALQSLRRSGARLSSDAAYLLAKAAGPEEVLRGAANFTLSKHDASILALETIELSRAATVIAMSRKGWTFESEVGLAMMKVAPLEVLDSPRAFSLQTADDLSRVVLAALASHEPEEVLRRLPPRPAGFSSRAGLAIFERSRHTESVLQHLACNADRFVFGDPAETSRFLLALITSGYEKQALLALADSVVELPVEVIMALLSKEDPSIDFFVIRNFGRIAAPRDDESQRTLVQLFDRLFGEYGLEAFISKGQFTAAALVPELDRRCNLSAIMQVRETLPEEARRLLDCEYSGLIGSTDGLHAVSVAQSLRRFLYSATEAAPLDESLRVASFYKRVVDYAFPNNAGTYTNFARNERCLDRSEDLTRFRKRPSYQLAEFCDERVVKASTPKEHARLYEMLLKDIQDALRAASNSTWDELRLQVLTQLAALPASDAEKKALRRCLLRFHLRDYIDEFGSNAAERLLEPRGLGQAARLAALMDSDLTASIGRIFRNRDNPGPLLNNHELYDWALGSLATQRAAKTLDRTDFKKVQRGFKLIARLGNGIELGKDPSEVCKTLLEVCGEAKKNPDLKRLAASCEQILGGNRNPELKLQSLRKVIHAETRKLTAIAGALGVAPETLQEQMQGSDPREFAGPKQDSSKLFSQTALNDWCELFLYKVLQEDRRLASAELEAFHIGEEKRQPITCEAYFAKNITAAHAPQVAGVCTTGETDIWDNPANFTLVLRDRDSRKCLGVVLLTEMNLAESRILGACFNPSSTYLKKIDEAALLHGLKNLLIEFARDNDFDGITVSSTRAIRSNRFDTVFEKTLVDNLESKETAFAWPRLFSLERQYVDFSAHFLWKK